MEKNVINFILLTSFIGLIGYSIWVIILVLNSIKNCKDDKNFIKIPSDFYLYILMPMLNEESIVNKSLQAFINNTCGLHQIKLFVIDDGSTDNTNMLIKKFIKDNKCQNKIKLIQRRLPNAQKGKGSALNYGLNYIIKNIIQCYSSKVIIGIFDSDAFMNKTNLSKVLIKFNQDSNLSLLQVKVRMSNINNWLERMQDIEFTTINDWIQRVRNNLGDAAASGNGQFIRLSLIKNEKNPWGNALLEDFEFSTRFLLENKKTKYVGNIEIYQEAVSKYKAFIKQRSRWVQGGIDCINKYLFMIFKSKYLKFWAKFEMTFYLFLPFINILIGTANLITLIYSLINFYKLWSLFLILLGINLLLSYYIGVKYCLGRKKINLITLIECAGLTIYNIIIFPAIILAIYRKIVHHDNWIKTKH